MDLRIMLLGSVELRNGRKRSLLGTPKQRLALAGLAWDANRTVGLDTLVHRIWDEDPPVKPREALYVHIHHIRRAFRELADDGDPAPDVVSRTHTYTLQIDPDAVDLRRYMALVEESRVLSASGSTEDARTKLRSAARLWSGEPLAGLPGAWAAHVRGLADESHGAATQLHADIALLSGQYAEAAAELQPLAGRYRTNEEFTGRLALALHGCGRTDEASRLLQQLRHHLRKDSGSDPGEKVAHIHRGILSGRPAGELLSQPTAAVSPQQSAAPSPDTLPPEAVCVGRQDELRRLTHALTARGATADGAARSTAVVVSGMAGSGKTALATHAARTLRAEFPDGQLFVDLRGHAPHQTQKPLFEVLREILTLVEEQTELPRAVNGLVAMWRRATRCRRFLVVLDDAASAEQVSPLLPGNSSSAVIITSRHRLAGLPGVRHIGLDALLPGDAIALLSTTLGEERVAHETESAVALARLCDYLPLALDISAHRLRTRPAWRLSDLVARFNRTGRRLPEIRAPRRAMAKALEVSYQALDTTQQQAFRRLGLHVTSEFGPGAAVALTGLPLDETEEVLEELLDCHLVLEPAPHRYRMHDLLREYATALAEEDPADERDQAVERLLGHYLHAADQADRRAYPHRQRIALPDAPDMDLLQEEEPQRWFTTEGPCLLAALEYARTQGPPRRFAFLAHTLAGFLGSEGYVNAAGPALLKATEYWQKAGDEEALSRALIDRSAVCAGAGDYSQAIKCAREVLDRAQRSDDQELSAEALHSLSICYWHTARLPEALEFQSRALRLRLDSSGPLQQGRSHNLMGAICLGLERKNEALAHFVEGLARFRGVGDRRGQFIALNNLAELHKEGGDLDRAVDFYRQSINLLQDLGSKGQYAVLQMNLADAQCARGELAEALRLYEQALPALRSAGDRRNEAIALTGMGRTLHSAGRSEQAVPLHAAAHAIARTIEAALEECRALVALGEAEAATGRIARARAHLEAGHEISRRINSRADEARAAAALISTRSEEFPYRTA